MHKDGDEVKVYSRALREVTPSVPEVVEQVRALPARSLILDGEVLALRPDGSPWPFQDTMRRFGRRLDVDAMRRELPLTIVLLRRALRWTTASWSTSRRPIAFTRSSRHSRSSIVIPHATSPTPEARRRSWTRRSRAGTRA